MVARKANKVYQIDETQKADYLKTGYDICDEKGNVIEHSPLSTVKYAEYEKLLKENAGLREANCQLSAELAAIKKKLSADQASKKKPSAQEKTEETPEQKGDM